jgi:non-ribosomal peptide synthetase component E (peptide arylation enzyme)
MEELKNIAPHLSQLPKKDAFTAPEGYFDDLPSRIQDRVITQRKLTSSNFSPVWIFSTLGVASVLCVMFFLGKSPEVQNSISEQEASAYINENLEQEFDETLLADELITSNNKTFTSDENLEEYILNQDIDEQLLREEI